MKKLILSITIPIFCISTINLSFADTGTSSVTWNNNVVECLTTSSHGITHYGVPNSNGGIGSSGSYGCTTHTYYPSADYLKGITATSGVTVCGVGERVVSWNGSSTITCRKWDDTPPLASDIGNSTPVDGTNLLATSSQNFKVFVSHASGSPITSVKNFFEDYDTINSWLGTSKQYIGASGVNENISNVDNQRINGSRQYSLRVAKICDEAGNCLGSDIDSSNLKTFNYDVYANTVNIGTKIVNSNQVSDISNIADGTIKNLTITLKDIYGNEIVPASGIGRTIDMNFNVKNTMYLNQQLRTGVSSVFLTSSNASDYTNKLVIGTATGQLNIQDSTDGNYTYKFKVYTPTLNQNNGPVSDSSAELTFNSITFDINSSLGSPTGVNPQSQVIPNGNFPTKFSPFYYTSFTGQLKTGGFIEGAVQKSKIMVYKNGGTSDPGMNTYLTFGGAGSAKYNLKFSKIGNPNILISKIANTTTYFNDNTDSDIKTLLHLSSPPAPARMNAYLATHISYSLDGKTITYNSDIVGKHDYFGSNTLEESNESGLKVVGITRSNKNQMIVENQIPNDIKIIGDSDKFISKTSIIKNGYTFAKNVTGETGVTNALTNINSPNTGTKVNSVIYFGAQSGNTPNKVYQLGNGTTDIAISTNKTILVIGGNLYIKSNLYYSSTNGMLGIVVLKDKEGNGGNVYIDPSVTNIVGSIFAEKSVISYNGTSELDGNTPPEDLKNQLHIYGNLFSENTMGGSNKISLECPYYVSSGNCDTKEKAQTYDLNYLRRYYLIDASLVGGLPGLKIPASNGKIIGGGTCEKIDSNSNGKSDCTGGNTLFAKNITNTTEPNANNSVIIEYNSKVQSNPPTLFKISN